MHWHYGSEQTDRTMFLCFSSFKRQISLKAELGTPCKRKKNQLTLALAHLHTANRQRNVKNIRIKYLVVVIQPNPFQSHYLVCFPVFRFEHCSICACGADNVKRR